MRTSVFLSVAMCIANVHHVIDCVHACIRVLLCACRGAGESKRARERERERKSPNDAWSCAETDHRAHQRAGKRWHGAPAQGGRTRGQSNGGGLENATGTLIGGQTWAGPCAGARQAPQEAGAGQGRGVGMRILRAKVSALASQGFEVTGSQGLQA